MGNTNQPTDKSRRWFFSQFVTKKEPIAEKIKMLTADGKLVEVDKNVVEQLAKKKKSSNKDIYEWMNNPSKKKDE